MLGCFFPVSIVKSFIGPIMDHGDVIYDKPNNESFKNKIESIQYKAYIAIRRNSPRERLYQKLGLEFPSDRCRF